MKLMSNYLSMQMLYQLKKYSKRDVYHYKNMYLQVVDIVVDVVLVVVVAERLAEWTIKRKIIDTHSWS